MTALGPNAGNAHITVKPSLRGWSADVRRQLEREQRNMPALQLNPPDSRTTRRAGERAGDEFASGFDRMVRKRVQGALASLPKAQIGVASSEAEQRIKDLRVDLERLSKQRIGIDVDAAQALARLRDIQAHLDRLSNESADINVKADTVLASAQLAAIHREVNALERDDATVRVGVNGAPSATSALSGLGSAASMSAVRLGAVAAAGIVLIPVLAQLVTLSATLATTLVAAGGGLGFLLAGLLGNILPVIKAQSELKQKQEEAASAAAAYASAQVSASNATQAVAVAEISASRAISDAQRAVADARRNSARAIASAEDAVTSAQDRRRDAQQDLTDAIEAARTKLADYQMQLRSAALDESGAALSVTQAQERLNEVLSDPTATQLQIDLARQSVKEAALSYDAATKRRKDLREQAAKDRKAGVQGDQGVMDAKGRLADANVALTQAETNLAHARADGARQVAAAETNLARARADGARQVAQARKQAALARAAEAAAAVKLAEANAEVQDRLAKLSGPASVFVKALDRAKDAWGRFVKATARASFGLAAKGLDLFTKLLPKFVPLVRRSSKAVGTLMTGFARFATGKEGRGFIRWLTRTAPKAIISIGRVLGYIAVGLGGLLGALTDTDTGFLGLTKRFADFGRSAGTSSAVRDFFEYAKKNGPIVADAIKAMAGVMVQFIKILALVGPPVLRVLTWLWKLQAAYYKLALTVARVTHKVFERVVLPVFRLVYRYISNVVIPVLQFLWRRVIKPVFGFIGSAAEALWKRFLRPAFQAISRQWELVGDKLQTVWRDFIKPTLTAFRDFIREDVVPAVKRGVDKLGEIFDGLKKAAGTPVKFVVDTVYNNGIRKVINAIPGVEDVDPVDTSSWPSYARGGVLPGYTPGRDVHRFVSRTGGAINLSGGEAFMRPEWTRDIGGASVVRYLNDASRMGGKALARAMKVVTGRVGRQHGEPGFFMGGVMPLFGGALTNNHGANYYGADFAGDFNGPYDLANPPAAVSAWRAGRVAQVIPGTTSYGNHILINHPNGLNSLYAHLSSFATRVGKLVMAGQTIGRVGDTGNADGAHLHFEIDGGTVSDLAGGPAASSGGGGIRAALGAVRGFAGSVPGMLKQLAGMGPWGGLLVNAVRSMGGSLRNWVNDKIWGPGPFPDVFDSGGLALGAGLLAKRTIQPERVLSPAQTAAFERQVATLDNWDRTARALAHTGAGPTRPVLDVARFRIVDWDKGLAELEYMATSAAEQVYADHTGHAARVDDLDTDY